MSMENKEINNAKLGFSLLELMIIIAILAITTAYAVEAYQVNSDKTKVQRVINFLSSKKVDMVEHASVHGELPTTGWHGDWDASDPDGDGISAWRMARSASNPNRVTIVAHLTNKTYAGSNGDKMLHMVGTLQPNGNINWVCGTREWSLRRVDFTYLPQSCQNLLPPATN